MGKQITYLHTYLHIFIFILNYLTESNYVFPLFYLSFQVDYEEEAIPDALMVKSPVSDVNMKYHEPPKSLVQSVLEARAMRLDELRPVSQLFEHL